MRILLFLAVLLGPSGILRAEDPAPPPIPDEFWKELESLPQPGLPEGMPEPKPAEEEGKKEKQEASSPPTPAPPTPTPSQASGDGLLEGLSDPLGGSGTKPASPSAAGGGKTCAVSPSLRLPGVAEEGPEAYHPSVEGALWRYEALKPPAGGSSPAVRTVTCAKRETMPNGTVRAEFAVSEGGKALHTEGFSFYGNVGHRTWVRPTLGAVRELSGNYAFKLPKGAETAWTQSDGGVEERCTAKRGPVTIFGTVYPDCVIAGCQRYEGGKRTGAVFRYFARGIGMIREEAYDGNWNLNQARSFDLRSVQLPE